MSIALVARFGRLVVIASEMVVINSPPLLINSGIASVIFAPKSDTRLVALSHKTGAFWVMLSRIPFTTSAPFAVTVGSASVIAVESDSIISGALVAMSATFCPMPAAMPFTISPPLAIMLSCPLSPNRLSMMPRPASAIAGAAVWTNPDSADGIAPTTFPSIGMRLLNRNVPALDASCCMAPDTSPPVAIFASTFFAEACIAPNDPLKVVAASSAATPVNPRSPWIAWIAA